MRIVKRVALGFVFLLNSLSANAQYQCDQMIQKQGVDICYNYYLKEPLWSRSVISAKDLKSKGYSRKGIRFYEEQLVPKKYRATLADYRKSGYDRGHLISNDDLNHSRKLQKETFSLSNINPQNPQLNRGMYRKAEKATRSLIIKSKSDGLVIAGGVYNRISPKRIGPHQIAVPEYSYRIVVLDNNRKYAYLFPNKSPESRKLKDYRVSISTIEKMTGFSFGKMTP